MIVAMLAVVGLAGGTVVATELAGPVPAAEAQYATGGSGIYKGLIDWIPWGAAGTAIVTGSTGGTTRTIDGQQLVTTCTVTSTSGDVVAYRPGNWTGDGLDDLYNIGGTGTSNQLVIGLANAVDGSLVSADVTCAATLDGAPVPLQGLVFADAEASNGLQGEYVEATPDGAATWRVIERFRTAGCPSSTQAILGEDATLRLVPDGVSCTQSTAGMAGPTAVAFMEGATSATLSADGGGRSAIALGVVLGADFGDAPAGYGAAGAIIAPSWTGGEIPVGTTNVFDAGFALATPTPPSRARLGATADAEAASQPTPDATGDGADEDGIPAPPAIEAARGETYTLEDVSCTGPGAVAGWIDWDRSGTFEADERSAVVDCASGSVDLTWTVPDDAASALGDDRSFLRLRIGPDADSLESPTGLTTSGEVEDYAVTMDIADAPLDCPANAPGILFQQAPSHRFEVDLATGEYADAVTYGRTFNAIGYNQLDGFIYGYVSGSTAPNVPWQIVRIGATGGAVNLGRPAGVVNSLSFNIGDVDSDGHYWLTSTGNNQPWYEIDLATMTVLATGTRTEPTGLSQGADWAYVPGGGDYLYRVMTNASNQAVLVGFNRTTHAQTVFGVIAGMPAEATTFGAVYADSTYLYASANASGRIYRIDVNDVTGALFAQGPMSGTNDGARCANSPIYLDFGDADDSYGTTLAADGPRHVLEDYSPTARTASLMLGATVDTEDDAAAGAAADGDGIDEDGVAPISATPGQPVTAQVTVTNSTGAVATLAGWVDLDGDGAFEASERVVQAIPATAGASSYTLAFPNLATTANTTARFRVFPGAVANPLPTGPVSGGEVEDHPVDTRPAPPLFLGCSALIDFDEGNQGWRAATTDGVNVISAPVAVGWTATEGNPGGALVSDDLDGNWTELWTPPLAANGYATDYSFATGTDLQFDYRNTTGIGYDVYVTLAGANGATYYYIFRDQIADSQQWTRVYVPLDAAEWHTGFDFDTGPIGAAPTAAQFEAALANVDHFAFSIEGQGGQDTTYFDNFGQPCEDYGDAPASYGSASHRAVNLDAEDHRAPVMLGASIDIEDGDQPTDGADGDDANGVDDEDGVAVNPALGYPTPTLRTGLDPLTFAPAQNTLDVAVSAAGYASAWVDWNQDGDFDDAGEQVANAQPVTPGTNQLTFEQGTNPNGTSTYLRVRYSTDAAAVASPTGAAPDGEVEDYRVLVERLIAPQTCVAGETPHYAFTFSQPVDATGTGGVGSSARYANVSVVNGVPVDMLVETIAGNMHVTDAPPNGFGVGGGALEGIIDADDARWQITNGAQIRYTFVESGTTTLVPIDGAFTINDLDGAPAQQEEARFTVADLAGYAVTEGSQVSIIDAGTVIRFRGSGDQNGGPESRFQVVLEGISAFTVSWIGGSNSGFGFDGDGDLTIQPPACSDFGDAPASYGTLLADDGARHLLTPELRLGTQIDFDPDGQPTPAANGDDTNRVDDEDGVSAPIVVVADEATSIPVSVVNATGATATLATWIDLDRNGVFDADELVVTPVPAAASTQTVTVAIPAGAASDGASFARFRLFPGEVAAPSPTGAADGGEVEDHPVALQSRELAVAKESDLTAESRPGDVVHYELTLTNTGTAPYTADVPAVLADDLSGVLDDATYNGDAAASAGPAPFYNAPTLTWSGPLAPGASVTVEYSVTLRAGGDGAVRNVAWAPEDPSDPEPPACDPPVDGVDPATGEPCATTEGELPRLTIAKQASDTELPAIEGTLTYTVTITNVGPGDFTAAAPASVTDDLTEVLDAASYNGDAASTVGDAPEYDAPELSWSGPLGAGQSAVITYSVTYLGTGDHVLRNLACVPEDLVAAGSPDCDFTQVPGSGLTRWKQVVASSDPVVAGTTLDYTLFFKNDGAAAADVDAVDDLSHVLDDAEVTVEPTASAGLDATRTGDRIAITGSVPAGATSTVTYRVTLLPDDERGDDVLANFLLDPDEEPPTDPEDCDPSDDELPDCTVTRAPRVEYEKSASVADDPIGPGSVVSYTITIRNTGAATGEVGRADNLTGVLDDATIGDAPESDTASVTVSAISGGVFTMGGELAPGTTARVTYTVVVNDQSERGDNRLANFVLDGPNEEPPGDCDPDDPLCTDTGLPFIEAVKTSDPASGSSVEAGDVIGYTLTFRNTGNAPGAVDQTDHLEGVLDDATVGAPTAPDGLLTPALAGDELRTTGVLPAGGSARIQYAATVRADGARGDNVIGNVVGPTGEEPECTPETCTDHPVGELESWKTVEPLTTPVEAGTILEYTLHFHNVGEGDVAVDKVDVLTGVLDDAELTSGPSAGALTATLAPDGQSIAVSGTAGPGDLLTVTYQVTIAPDGERGDDVAANFLLDPGEDPPADGDCEPADDELPDCTSTSIGRLEVTKSVVSSTPEVGTGTVLSYTLTFHNAGGGAVTVDKVDDLSDVLDDGALTTAPAASNAALAVAPLDEDDLLAITGELAGGQTVTVTYTVTVAPEAERGNDSAANFVLDPGEDPPADCDPDATPCTVTELPHVVATKSVVASTDPVGPGTVLSYTLSFENVGRAAGSVEKVDDLSGVLDDGELTGAPTPADPDTLQASAVVDNRFTVTGSLDPGAVSTVSYQVTISDESDRGDSRAVNFLLAPGQNPPAACDPATGLCTDTPMPELHDRKEVAPASGTPVVPGQELTYTLTFWNAGTAAGAVDRVDDLSHVLDDAELISGPEASDVALAATGPGADARIAIAGTLAPGDEVTVTYTVRVLPSGERGDDVLANFLLDPGAPPPATPDCEPTDGAEPDCTSNEIGEIVPSKSVDPATGTLVATGQVLTYTLRFENVGTGAAALDYTDHLERVLDDADLTSPPVATGGAAVERPSADAIHIVGSVPGGTVATVTYQVTVRDYTRQGDHRLGNFVTRLDLDPRATCLEDDPLCTENPIDPPPAMVSTGTEGLWTALATALAAAGVGTVLLLSRRRRGRRA